MISSSSPNFPLLDQTRFQQFLLAHDDAIDKTLAYLERVMSAITSKAHAGLGDASRLRDHAAILHDLLSHPEVSTYATKLRQHQRAEKKLAGDVERANSCIRRVLEALSAAEALLEPWYLHDPGVFGMLARSRPFQIPRHPLPCNAKDLLRKHSEHFGEHYRSGGELLSFLDEAGISEVIRELEAFRHCSQDSQSRGDACPVVVKPGHLWEFIQLCGQAKAMWEKGELPGLIEDIKGQERLVQEGREMPLPMPIRKLLAHIAWRPNHPELRPKAAMRQGSRTSVPQSDPLTA